MIEKLPKQACYGSGAPPNLKKKLRIMEVWTMVGRIKLKTQEIFRPYECMEKYSGIFAEIRAYLNISH